MTMPFQKEAKGPVSLLAECCTPTAEEEALLASGEYRPEELWGGPRPTCPKCIGAPPVLLPTPPSHEEGYANNLTEALRERDALRNTLLALAPDLKVMAILYQQQGQSQRAQALMAIRESLGLGQ